MTYKVSAWKYYLPDDGETARDAHSIYLYGWQSDFIYDFDAAEAASKDEWNNLDGWETGVGEGPKIAVIAPNGLETLWATEREATVSHSVTLEEETTS